MPELIETNSKGKDFAEASWIILGQTANTILVFKPELHSGGVRGYLVRFKKDKEKWTEMSEHDFRKLKLFDGVKIELSTEQTAKLCDEIKKISEISKGGIEYGNHQYIVGKQSEVIIVNDLNKSSIISQLLLNNYPDEFWNALKNSDDKIARKLSYQYIQETRRESLDEFERELLLMGVGHEDYWQKFFENNKWIFGYGLNYQILKQETTQAYYGGASVDGVHGERGDFLCSTAGNIGFTVLVEIKTPAAKLLRGKQEQRNGAWGLSSEIVDGVTQLQANCSRWLDGSKTDNNKDFLESKNIYTTSPKGILLIGNLNEISNDRNKRNTFERYRQSIHGIEIITFDELLERAKFILGENK